MSSSGSVLRRGFGFLWENRWTFSVPVATLLLPATLWVVHMPDVFKATAAVRVNPPRLPHTGTAGPQEQESRVDALLATTRDRLLDEQNVRAILPILRPPRRPGDPEGLRAATAAVSYDQIPSEAGFKVSIEDRDPKAASESVNTLLKAFLTRERDQRVASAAGTRERAEGYVAAAQAELERAQAALRTFREGHGDAMPDRKDSVLSELLRVETELRDREAAAANARRVGQEYEKLMRQTPPEARTPGQPAQNAEEEQASLQMKGAQSALDSAKKELSAAQTKYTDKHPAVVQLLAEVARLETDVAKARDDLASAHKRAEATASERHGSETKPWLESLQQIRASVAEEESRAKQEAEDLRTRAKALRATLSAIPDTERAVEPLLTAYTAAAANLKTEQERLRNARESEDAFRRGEDLEATSYSVYAWAVPPVSPSGPVRERILLTAVGAGLLLGYVVLLVRRRYGEGAVLRPEDVADLVPEALVVRVPVLGADGHDRRARAREAGLALYVATCLIVSALALAAHKGWVAPPEWFRSYLGNTGGTNA